MTQVRTPILADMGKQMLQCHWLFEAWHQSRAHASACSAPMHLLGPLYTTAASAVTHMTGSRTTNTAAMAAGACVRRHQRARSARVLCHRCRGGQRPRVEDQRVHDGDLQRRGARLAAAWCVHVVRLAGAIVNGHPVLEDTCHARTDTLSQRCQQTTRSVLISWCAAAR
jgi:hypothetical protein